MEVRHLKYFVMVAEEGHITRAAERLGMQQPPLSRQIRLLEQELKIQLLRRKARGVELTAAGESFLRDAKAVLSMLQHASAAAKRAARGEEGRLSIGFTSSSPFHPLIPKVFRRFRESQPDVPLTLNENATSDLVEGLRAEQLDLAFTRTAPTGTEDVMVESLLREPMVLALPSFHKLASSYRRSGVHFGDLSEEKFVLYRRPNAPGLYDEIIACCRAYGFTPRIGQEAPRVISTLNLVAAGLGVSLVPESLARMRLEGITFRKLSGPSLPNAPLFLFFRRNDPSPAVHRFPEVVRRCTREFAGGSKS